MNTNREANLAVGFVVGAILTVVGLVAEDLRVLAFVGAPIALTCWLLSRAKLVVLITVFGIGAIRFLFTLVVTGDLWMAAGMVVCVSAIVILLRMAGAEVQGRQKSRK